MTYVFAQQKKTNLICTLALLVLMTNDCAHAATIIYGMQNISKLSSHAKGPFYIQLGSFHSASNAQNYVRGFAKLHYPITIKQHGSFHAVMVGPLTSIDAVKALILPNTFRPTSQKKPSPRLKKPKLTHHIMQPVIQPVPITARPQKTNKQTTSSINYLQSHGYVQADIGLSATLAAGSTEVNDGAVDPYPANVDVYSTKLHKQGGMASIMAGLRWQEDRTYVPAYSFALRYQNMFNQAISGTITQYSDPVFNNYNYNWKVQSNVFSVFSKVNLLEYKRFLPYVDAGIGYALNQSGHYQETPLGGVIARIDSPNFRSQSSSQFSYNLGAGLDYQLNQQWLLSIGYEFQDLGSIRSSFGQPPWSAGQLALDNYKANTVLLSLSYLLGV